jgi:hypothetical protein
MTKSVKLRPHHLLCAVSFEGHGYSGPFVENFSKIVKQLRSNDETIVEIVGAIDDVCLPCPNRIDNSLCKDQAKIQSLDQRHSNVLHVIPGDTFTWKEAKQKLIEKMTLEQFHKACDGCSWKPMGVCEKALKTLRA